MLRTFPLEDHFRYQRWLRNISYYREFDVAVTPVCAQDAKRNVSCIYVGTVTDSMGSETEEWSGDLIEAVKGETIHPHDELIKFMVEIVLLRLNT